MTDLDYNLLTIRPASSLTASYVAGTIIDNNASLPYQNQLNIYCFFTIGALTSATIKVEFSADGNNWVQEVVDELTSGSGIITERLATRTILASGNYRLSIPLKDRYVRISAIGNIEDNTSSLSILAIVGTA